MGRHLDSILKRGFRPMKCATLLKLTVSRIKLARNQKTNFAKQLRKEIAQLLQSGQDSHAYRLKTEQLVRTQNLIAAYDLIDHYCKLVTSRMQIIDTQRNCPLDVKEAVASLIYAASRCSDLVDLPHVRKMFTKKYGKEFTAAVLELRLDHGVNTQIIELLSTRPATGQTKLKLMQEIAAENNIEWKGEIAPADGGAEPVEENVSHSTENGQPLQAGQDETARVSDSESDVEFQDAVEGNVSDSKEAAESKRGFQNAVEAGVSVVALNDESTEGTHAHDSESDRHEDNAPNTGAESPLPAKMSSSKSDEVTRMPSQRVDENGAYLGSGRTQYEDSATAKLAALPHVSNVPNARTESPPSEMPSLKSDEVARMPSHRFYEDGTNLGSFRRNQFKDSANAAQAALPHHEDNVLNAGTASSPTSEKPSSKSAEVTRRPSQRFYEDGANLGSGRRHYKDSASAGQAALPDEDDVPNTGTESPPPSKKASSKSDEVTRMPSQKFYEDGVYLGSGKRRHYKDFASAAQVAFESAARAAEAAQAAMGLARFVDEESGSFKYSSFSNNLDAKAAGTEIPKARPEFDSKLFESNVDQKKVTEEPKAHPEFDGELFEGNVDPKTLTEEPKARPEIGRKISDASTVYLDSFPSAVFTSARKAGERSDKEVTSSSDDDVGGMSNPTWDSEDVSQEKTSPAKSGSGHRYFKQKSWRNSEGSADEAEGSDDDASQEKTSPAKSGSGRRYFKQKSWRNSEGSADEAEGSDDDAMINPVSLWNRRVAGARLATEDVYAERPRFDDEEDSPGELFGRNSLEKVNSRSGEFSTSSSFSTRTQRGSSKHSSFSTGTFEEDGGGEKFRFERGRLPEDTLAAGRGSEVFSNKPEFDDEEVNDGRLASGMGQFARVSSGHDREKAESAAALAPLPVSEAWRRSEAKPRWSSSSSNVAEDIQYEQKTVGHGESRRTTWANKRRPLVSPPKVEQYDEATAASATSWNNFTKVEELDRGSSKTKVAANDAAVEAVGGGVSASAVATLPSRHATKVANDAAVETVGGGGSASATATLPPSRQAAKVASDAAVASRRAAKTAASDTTAEGGGGSASVSAVTLSPPRQTSAAAVALSPSRQGTKVVANDTTVASRRGTKVAANDATVEGGGNGGSASAAAVYFPPPSRQVSALADALPPPTRPPPPPPALTLQIPLTSSPSSLTSPLTPSFSDPVVLASTPPPPRTPSTASTSSSPVPPPHLSTAASAPPPAARDSLRAPHRHPKLPDYEDFVAHFEKLRQGSGISPSS